MTLPLQISKITPDNRKLVHFNTKGNRQPPLKMDILKIRFFFHVRKDPNIGREPQFHDSTTSNVKDYPGQQKRQNRPKKRVFNPKRGLKVEIRKSGFVVR